MTKFSKAIFFLALTFFAGVLWWAIFLFHTFPKNHYIEKNYSKSENVAIIVLTGGKGRIEKGIQLLNNGYGNKLFISGVFLKTDIKSKLEYYKIDSNFFECCIFFDNKAKNTKQNVIEVKSWLSQNKDIEKLILVSSYYHLPRGLITFNKFLPDINIKVSPVSEKKEYSSNFFFHLKLFFFEYFKVIYTLFFY